TRLRQSSYKTISETHPMWFRTKLLGKSPALRRRSTCTALADWESFEPRRLLSVALPAAERQRVALPNATGAAGAIGGVALNRMTAEDEATPDLSGGSFSGSGWSSGGTLGAGDAQAGDTGQSADGDISPLLGKVSW